MTPKELAREKLAARRRRTSAIRNAVAAIAMAMFIALFSVIYVQMATGNDPALGASVSNQKVAIAKASTSGSSTTSSTTDESTSSTDDSSSSSSSSSGSTSSAQSSPTPVTTQQS